MQIRSLFKEIKKKSENDPFYFSNSTSTVCRLLWNLDYWFLQGMDKQRIWGVGRHETLATPHIRLAEKQSTEYRVIALTFGGF